MRRDLSIRIFLALLLASGACVSKSAPGTPTAPPASAGPTFSRFGLTLTYPPSWTVSDSALPDAVDFTSGQAFLQLHQMREVNPSRLPVDVWFDQNVAGQLSGPIWSRSTVTVGGRQALRVETSSVGSWINLYVPSGADVIAISYEVGTAGLESQYETMVSSLAFIN